MPGNERNREAVRKYRKKNRDRLREKERAWRAANRERFLSKQKAYRESNPERVALYQFRSYLKRYGLTPDEFEALLVAQNGVCALCREPQKNGRRLDVDHDHATGRVRGLLCNNCNRGLGFLSESPLLMRAAADYLERSK